MSIPATITLYKLGRRLVSFNARASYSTRDGLSHIKHCLTYITDPICLYHDDNGKGIDIVDEYGNYKFDAIETSFDGGSIYYLTGEGMFANEVLKEE